MVIWWLCWHRTLLIRNITQKQYSQFPPVHDFGKPWWGVAYVVCMTNLRALCAWVNRWHVTCMLSLAEHWQGLRALSNNVCAQSVIPMWHVVCLQHLARACSEQSRSTTVLPINHVIQMPQCLSGFVNHDYWGPIWNSSHFPVWERVAWGNWADGLFCLWFTINSVCGVANDCHQVRCMCWETQSLFHGGMGFRNTIRANIARTSFCRMTQLNIYQ